MNVDAEFYERGKQYEDLATFLNEINFRIDQDIEVGFFGFMDEPNDETGWIVVFQDGKWVARS